MTVIHLMNVHLYNECLERGGTHRFEITPDEMPGLRLHPNTRFGVRLTCEEALPLSSNVWRGVLLDLAKVDAICTYRRRDHHTYEVICYVPMPSARHKGKSSNRDADDSPDEGLLSPKRDFVRMASRKRMS